MAAPRRPAGARALGLFWAAVLVLGAAGVGTLHVLGPLPKPELPPTPPAPSAAAPAWDGRIAAPVPALLEPSAFPPALLPRIGADGRTPRAVYARPAVADGRPRVALVLAGLGLADADTRTAIERLPGPVTLAFSAYSPDPDPLVALARAGGHELLQSLPMEPEGAPFDNPGDRALTTSLRPAENLRHLEWVMGRTQGYVGLTGASDGMRGERFAALASGFNMALDAISRRGLLYLDPRPTEGRAADPLPAPHVRTDYVLDDPPGRADIDAKLVALERLARDRGFAVGLAGQIRPATLDKIVAWAQAAEGRGIQLVPVSALAVEPAR